MFTASGLNLFPFTLNEVRSRCSCPDKANPCKHIAAVYYQLADRFSEDPFVIFQLRGKTRNQILDTLRQIRSQRSASVAADHDRANQTEAVKTPPSLKATSLSNNNFWQYDEPLESSLVAIVPPMESKTILDLLGRFPLPPADADAVQQYLSQVYQNATQQAIMSALNR